MDLKKELEQLRDKALTEFRKISDSDVLWNLEKKYLGRNGELAQMAKHIKDVADEQRPLIGQIINEVKEALQEGVEEVKNTLGVDSSAGTGEKFDPTRPGTRLTTGRLHPITQLLWNIEDIFRSLGFGVLEGPEVESEWYNFEALNIPAWHPARDSQDTFFIREEHPDPENRLVLRTQTSPVQIRAMEIYGAPLRVIVPGRVYRNEATDARHENNFWQVEGLVIDKNISVAHLKGVMDYVMQEMLGAKTRWRPGYFPFTEPSLEMDIECLLCKSEGCRVCKYTGWLEFMGAGLVHPNVIKAGGLDPKEWSGFAFGMGPERLHMLKYGVNDIRLYKSGDLRFLEQF